MGGAIPSSGTADWAYLQGPGDRSQGGVCVPERALTAVRKDSVAPCPGQCCPGQCCSGVVDSEDPNESLQEQRMVGAVGSSVVTSPGLKPRFCTSRLYDPGQVT